MQKRNMTPVQAMELCRANDALTEKDIWAFAEQLREDGHKGLIGYLMETNETRFAAKVAKAAGAKAEREREKMTRVQILEEAAGGKVPSICTEPDACYGQMKAQLRRTGLDGPFQRLVYTALKVGRGAQPRTHATLARVPKHGIPGQDMTRGKGGENARLFDKWTDLEVILISCFYTFRDTVLQK